MIISAAEKATGDEPVTVAQLLSDLGPLGVVVLLAVGGCLLLWVIGKTGRRLLAKAVGRLLKRAAKAFVRYVRISLWA
ncbi:hypothetical protein, partial [Streptomyces sp. DSM 41029]